MKEINQNIANNTAHWPQFNIINYEKWFDEMVAKAFSIKGPVEANDYKKLTKSTKLGLIASVMAIEIAAMKSSNYQPKLKLTGPSSYIQSEMIPTGTGHKKSVIWQVIKNLLSVNNMPRFVKFMTSPAYAVVRMRGDHIDQSSLPKDLNEKAIMSAINNYPYPNKMSKDINPVDDIALGIIHSNVVSLVKVIISKYLIKV